MDILAIISDNAGALRIHAVENCGRSDSDSFKVFDGETKAPDLRKPCAVQARGARCHRTDLHFMTKNSEVAKPRPDQSASSETEQQRFERVLSLRQFKPLKAILDQLRIDGALLRSAVATTTSYPDFLLKLGYRLVLAKQIHEQDCYARLGAAGGIRAVLPFHDTDSYSTLVTLVNFDSTVATTPNAVGFFTARLAEFKTQLMN
jgi:hypothetical protein